MAGIRYIVVVGGSYVGVNTAQKLANAFAGRMKVLLIEKNSHFQHLFAFPRFAVTANVETHRAFIPYRPGTFADCPKDSGLVVQARAVELSKDAVQLDREVEIDGRRVRGVDYAYLVLATGTQFTPPSTLPGSEKLDGVQYLRKHAQKVQRSQQIVVIGGGAVGVQTATDIAQLYPSKSVTLVHSRTQLMNKFHPAFDQLIQDRCRELGITLKLGSRVQLPPPDSGYPTDGRTFTITFQDNSAPLETDFAIIATGQIPQSTLLHTLSPSRIDSDGYIHTLRTLQIGDPSHPNIFAVGDIAATGAPKAARPAMPQADLVVRNIEHLESGEGDKLEELPAAAPAAIHLTLGIEKSVIFRNPAAEGAEPGITMKDDGTLDMGIQGVWKRRGGGLDAYL